ncbi:hypothetical protein HCA58_01345 [Micromonospora sp. HNM0581]|nr:hypothetical protein [Micromonospora sp. HNM0581]
MPSSAPPRGVSPATKPQNPAPPRSDPAPAAHEEPTPASVATPAGVAATPEARVTPGVPRPRRVGGRTWQILIGGAAALVLLALCGLTAATLLDGRTLTGQQAGSTAAPDTAGGSATAEASELDSRDTDQAPLTAREVFPASTLALGDGGNGYEVLRTQSSDTCTVAATGEVSELLVRLGCNQVVRATLRTPDGDHLVTTGLFNLTDRSSAERARDRIRQLLDERQGRFRGMSAGDDTDAVTTAPARVGWQVRGHYIAYALVTRTDGATIRSGDTGVREILFDMLEQHLNQSVLGRRAAGGTASQPTGSPADDTGAQNGSTAD